MLYSLLKGGIHVSELALCPRRNAVFIQSIRVICRTCDREAKEALHTVFRFRSKRENREATLAEIVEATGVEEELIIKFVKEKRLLTSQFPKLSYPCEKCGEQIVTGKL